MLYNIIIYNRKQNADIRKSDTVTLSVQIIAAEIPCNGDIIFFTEKKGVGIVYITDCQSTMISYIKGKAISVKNEYAVIECNNIGFKIYMPFSQSSSLPDGETTVYTYMYIREGVMDLYGFSNEESLELFEILIGVSGVGPKAAIGMLDTLSPATIISSITSGDFKTLTKAPGIGAKIAQRIVLELSSKLKNFVTAPDTPVSDNAGGSDMIFEIASALISLGYGEADAKSAAASAADAKNVSDGIKKALKYLM